MRSRPDPSGCISVTLSSLADRIPNLRKGRKQERNKKTIYRAVVAGVQGQSRDLIPDTFPVDFLDQPSFALTTFLRDNLAESPERRFASSSRRFGPFLSQSWIVVLVERQLCCEGGIHLFIPVGLTGNLTCCLHYPNTTFTPTSTSLYPSCFHLPGLPS